MLYNIDWDTLRESAKLGYVAISMRELLSFDEDVARLHTVMNEANLMDAFECFDDFHRRSPKFSLGQLRDMIDFHVGTKILMVRPFSYHINVLLILKVFNLTDHVFYFKFFLFH